MTTSDDAGGRRARLLRLLLEKRGVGTDDGVLTVARTGVLRASIAQERMWFMDRVAAPRSFLHNVPLGARLRGRFDVEALQAAVNALVARQESLRTSFSLSGAMLASRIHDKVELPIVYHDVSAAPDPWAVIARLDYLDAVATFNLTRVPLLRVTLCRLAEEDHVLLVTAHHVTWDGWSTGLLVHELAVHYEAARKQEPADLAPLPVQYLEWAAWERRNLVGDTLQRHLDYWHRELAGAPTVHVPPVVTDTAGLTTDRGMYVTFTVTPDVTAALTELARREDATLYMVLLASFTALLHRLSGEDDVNVGGLIANRTRPEIEGLIGYFVNMVPIRSRVGPHTTFQQHLRNIRATTLGVHEHQALPRGRIVRHLARYSEGAFDQLPYSVTFQLQTAPRVESDFGELQFEILDRHTGTSGFDLSIVLWQRLPDLTEYEGLRGWCEYRTDRFDELATARMMDRYISVLEAVARDQSIRLTDLPVFAPEECTSAVVLGPDDGQPFEAVPTALRRHALDRSASIAIRNDRAVLTYGALGAAIAATVRQLRQLGVGPETLVAVVDCGSPAMLVAACAVMSQGAAFSLLDPAGSDVRSGTILRRLQPVAAFVGPGSPVPLPSGTHRLPLPHYPPGEEPVCGPAFVHPQALVQVTFTPGPGGPPVGVMIPHSALTAKAHGVARSLGLRPNDVVAHPVPQAFTGPIAGLLASLVSGAQLRLVPIDVTRDQRALASLIAEEGVTVVYLPPSALGALLAAAGAGGLDLGPLRSVVVDGEALPDRLVREWRAVFPRIPLVTEYAVAECCGTVSRFEPAEGWPGRDADPIGPPAVNTSLYLVDPLLSAVGDGAGGEVCVGGVTLGRGYLGDPRRTAERFVPDPFSPVAGARLYRTGRRGYRPEGAPIELRRCNDPTAADGERVDVSAIDAVLDADPGVCEAAAVVRRDPELGARVVAYVVPAPSPSDGAEEEHIRRWRDIYDDIHAGPPTAAPDFDLPGWATSYDGAPITPDGMRGCVETTVDRVGAFGADRILDIGCGTGLLVWRFAQGCEEYAARDVSPVAVDRLGAALADRPIASVSLSTAEAADLDDVPLGRYDLVVLKSVVHCFPSAGYLQLVLRQAVDRVATGGCVFLGDIRSLALRRAFHSAVELARADADTPASELRARVERAQRGETELALDPRFFAALRRALPRIAAVELLPTPGQDRKEMTQFRFDVVLHIDVAPRSPSPAAGLAWADSPGLDNIGDMLRGGPPSLEVRGIPDARCATALSAERVLDEPLPGATAHGLRTATGSSAADVAPDDLAALGARYGYTVATALDLGAPGHFNAVLCRDTVAGRRAVLPADDAAAADSPEPLANSPMRIARRGKFLTDLRRRLDDRLPAAHVPSTFVVLDALPRLSDGSVNRAGLPAPAGPRHRRSPRTPPRDRIEREVAIVWSDVLEVCDIGVTDRLVEDLGVDDVRGSILAATLREKFQIRLGLHDLRCEPTIAAVARRISRPHERGGAADARRA